MLFIYQINRLTTTKVDSTYLGWLANNAQRICPVAGLERMTTGSAVSALPYRATQIDMCSFGSFHVKSPNAQTAPTQIWWKCIYMVPVTQIEGIHFFFNLTSYFQIYGTFKFYENVNFRVKGVFKNPHYTKYVSHRTI